MLIILLAPLALRRGQAALLGLAQRRREWLAAALIAGVAPLLGFTAFSLGPVGYVATLFRLSAVFTVVWSGWRLGETGLWHRLPASLVMVAGAVLIVV